MHPIHMARQPMVMWYRLVQHRATPGLKPPGAEVPETREPHQCQTPFPDLDEAGSKAIT